METIIYNRYTDNRPLACLKLKKHSDYNEIIVYNLASVHKEDLGTSVKN